MKNITRLALAFAVATLAALAPMAHADEAQLVPPDIQKDREYVYNDKDGPGTMFVKDGPPYPWGRPISVTFSQNGYTFSGQGWRKYASSSGTDLFAYCEFWLYGSGTTAKFKGYLTILGAGLGGGDYFLNGHGSPYWWSCYLE
jgi:hypothetical protein